MEWRFFKRKIDPSIPDEWIFCQACAFLGRCGLLSKLLEKIDFWSLISKKSLPNIKRFYRLQIPPTDHKHLFQLSLMVYFKLYLHKSKYFIHFCLEIKKNHQPDFISYLKCKIVVAKLWTWSRVFWNVLRQMIYNSRG